MSVAEGDNTDPSKITLDDIRYSGAEKLRYRIVATLTREDGTELLRLETGMNPYGWWCTHPVSFREGIIFGIENPMTKFL